MAKGLLSVGMHCWIVAGRRRADQTLYEFGYFTERQVASAIGQVSMDRIVDIIGSVRRKGVRLWSQNGRLHYRALKGVLTQDEIERLHESRDQIVALLERATGGGIADANFEARLHPNCAPLTFSQLAHWYSYQLSERRAIRQVASAIRLRGRLDVDAFQRSVAEVVSRHDALRTRVVVRDGIPTQEIDESVDFYLEVSDLTALATSFREDEIRRSIEQLILQPIDVAVGPLFGMRLLRLQDDEHVLIVAMEHMISDACSREILLRELFAAYAQATSGREFSLPAIPVQFADYAVRQSKAKKSWIEKHSAYWNEHLTGCQRVRFPEDQSLQARADLGWGVVPIKIGRDLMTELRVWCRLRQTTLVMGVVTAYVALVLRWCGVSEAVTRYAIDGRDSAETENTIGFFASVLYLRVGILEEDSFVDLLNRVTREYCRAYEHADFSYLAAQVPRPEFTKNTAFNWIPRGSKTNGCELDGSRDTITRSPIRFSHPMARNLGLDAEPSIVLYAADDEIVGDVYFPANRFSADTIERFGRNFLMFIRALLNEPERRVNDVLLT